MQKIGRWQSIGDFRRGSRCGDGSFAYNSFTTPYNELFIVDNTDAVNIVHPREDMWLLC